MAMIFSKLPVGIFDELTSLDRLLLYQNDLSTLPADIFDELTSLDQLWLHQNDLSILPNGLFDELAELSVEDLFLEANPGAPFSPVVNAGADLSVQPGAAVSISGSVTGPWGGFCSVGLDSGRRSYLRCTRCRGVALDGRRHGHA